MSRVTRRGFLVLAGAAAAGGVAKLLTDGDDDERARELARAVAAALSDPRSARRVGAVYRRTATSEADAPALARALRGSHRAWGRVSGPGAVRRLARVESRRDYAAGRVVVVDGWHLSRTEARLCALASLA
jgi:hypothetical protein